jgi:hypothetical protein
MFPDSVDRNHVASVATRSPASITDTCAETRCRAATSFEHDCFQFSARCADFADYRVSARIDRTTGGAASTRQCHEHVKGGDWNRFLV